MYTWAEIINIYSARRALERPTDEPPAHDVHCRPAAALQQRRAYAAAPLGCFGQSACHAAPVSSPAAAAHGVHCCARPACWQRTARGAGESEKHWVILITIKSVALPRCCDTNQFSSTLAVLLVRRFGLFFKSVKTKPAGTVHDTSCTVPAGFVHII